MVCRIILDETAEVTLGCPSLLYSVMRERRPIWINMFCSSGKQPILALMKSPDRLSRESEWRRHANTMCCGTPRVGFWHELWITSHAGFVFSRGPLMIVLGT